MEQQPYPPAGCLYKTRGSLFLCSARKKILTGLLSVLADLLANILWLCELLLFSISVGWPKPTIALS